MLTEELLQKYESTISFNAGNNLCHISQTLLDEVRKLQQQNKQLRHAMNRALGTESLDQAQRIIALTLNSTQGESHDS